MMWAGVIKTIHCFNNKSFDRCTIEVVDLLQHKSSDRLKCHTRAELRYFT